MTERSVLLDVTRLISRSWTRRLPTGIDRVCSAYLDWFGDRARAVVQHRGIFRVLTFHHSQRLFEMLRGADLPFRRRLLNFAPKAYRDGEATIEGSGAIYLNVSHTDFDLSSHVRWVERCGLRSSYLIHDLIPITHADLCRPRAVARHRGRVTNALQSAAGIIVSSKTVASELATFAYREGLPLPPVIASPLAGAELTPPPDPVTLTPQYFVCVGTIEKRKNHQMLLDVWKRLIRTRGKAAPTLIIIGQSGGSSDEIWNRLKNDYVLQRHVRVLSRCSDAELAVWIAGAQAVLMPTLAEGFGLPLVESLRLGTPVIASDLPCFREIGMGIPTLLDPMDAKSWEYTLLHFGESHPERRRQLRQMSAYQAPSWSDHFADIENWLFDLPADAVHKVKEHNPFAAALDTASGDPVRVGQAN
jgi:glycosyltransferase involved in cell wall biosynthesis